MRTTLDRDFLASLAWYAFIAVLLVGAGLAEANTDSQRHAPRHVQGHAISVWDDLRLPLTTSLQGILSKPDFDYTNLGLLFPQNDATEIAYLHTQIPHGYELGTDIKPHIHYVQDEADNPTWKIDYRWYENGSDPTGGFTTITANTFQFTYTSGSILQIASWPAIDGSGITGISSMLDIKLYRDDNTVTGDILAKEFDIHYELDRVGSQEEFTK